MTTDLQTTQAVQMLRTPPWGAAPLGITCPRTSRSGPACRQILPFRRALAQRARMRAAREPVQREAAATGTDWCGAKAERFTVFSPREVRAPTETLLERAI